MEDVILIIAVIAVMIFGFFIMKRLDVFIDSENYENMISGIESFKKSHKTVTLVIFDGENRELTDVLNDYKSRFK